jgi:3-oxoacyl-[acyl-carrier-protein] synthase II
MPYRVAITGIGLVTPLGIGTEHFWLRLCAGEVAVGPLTRFDAQAYPTRVAAQIDDFDPAAFLSRRRVQWTDRFSQFAVAAARLAVDDARLPLNGARADLGVFTGSALGGVALAEDEMTLFRNQGLRAVHPLLTISVFGGAAASNVAIEFGITGPATANANSCASGAMAIGDAFHAIRRGELRAAIAGGAEAPLAPLTFGAFNVAKAMSRRNDDPQSASRPFDAQRDGFVMAEGAAMLVLERYDDALSRDALVYGEIAGYGASNDAYHMSAPLEDGAQTARALQRALDDANVGAAEVEAINAHGSSTPLGDRAESRAYEAVFGERLARIPVSATKGQHGHALGATGAWEMAVALLGMRDGIAPGAVNLQQLDGTCAIDCTRETRASSARIVLSNSSGFGGMNAALVVRGAQSSLQH